MRKRDVFRTTVLLAVVLALGVSARAGAADRDAPQRLPITPTGPAPESGHYAAGDEIEFLIDNDKDAARLRFVASEEIFYLSSEPATLGGRILKYDTGEVAIAVSGWGGVTLYTQKAPGGIPAERIGEASNFDPKPVTARETKIFAARLSQRLADRDNLAVGFAADWDRISQPDSDRALAVDSMRNAAYALAELAATNETRAGIAARIHVIRIVAGDAAKAQTDDEVLTVTFAANGEPAARPSSFAIAEVIQSAP